MVEVVSCEGAGVDGGWDLEVEEDERFVVGMGALVGRVMAV